MKYRVFAGVFDGLAAAEKGLKPLFFNYCAEKSRKQLLKYTLLGTHGQKLSQTFRFLKNPGFAMYPVIDSL